MTDAAADPVLTVAKLRCSGTSTHASTSRGPGPSGHAASWTGSARQRQSTWPPRPTPRPTAHSHNPQATAPGGFRETAAAPPRALLAWRRSLRLRAVSLPSPRVPSPVTRFDHVATANRDLGRLKCPSMASVGYSREVVASWGHTQILKLSLALLQLNIYSSCLDPKSFLILTS